MQQRLPAGRPALRRSLPGGAAGSVAQPATTLRSVLRGATPRVNGQRFGKAKQRNTNPSNAKQSKAMQTKAKPKQSNAKQSKATQSKESKTKQSKLNQSKEAKEHKQSFAHLC